ncbi:uncharacterized protein LOC108143716 isoform X2 [Drosophila elegans]|uniref:uncharacterized protein LOC108143716 isoform X2 n=1 Tax=Drosophila elegans TaxID=30023 RepID=UPI001BC85C0C|nr:uncharacterized protein LOC108143716 isoform X2 [Drosophila elegans]
MCACCVCRSSSPGFFRAMDARTALHSHIHHVNGHRFLVQASYSWHQPDAYGTPRDPAVRFPNTEPPPQPAIMGLNDLCLEHVLQYLELEDQIHFARSCLRFRGVYQLAIARRHKTMRLTQFKGMTVWDMRDFFRLSCCHVQHLADFQGASPAKGAQH